MADVGRVEHRKIGQQGDIVHYVCEFTVTHADLTAAATSEALDVPGFPANIYPLRGRELIGEYFTDGVAAIATTCTAELGDAGNPDGLVASLDVFSTTALASWDVATDGAEAEYGTLALEASYAPQVLITSDVNVDTLDQGILHGKIYYKTYEVS